MLSVIIPAYNEELLIEKSIKYLYEYLNSNGINHEIIVVNDHSTDKTYDIVKELEQAIPTVHIINNINSRGYGNACIGGLKAKKGSEVAFFMADLSDSPNDLVNYHKILATYNCDMVFGNRWLNKHKVSGYPLLKRIVNRFANYLVAILFQQNYFDVTNGFKLYRKDVIESLMPFEATQFNFALELPLRAIISGYSFRVIDTSWHNNKKGKSNLKLKNMFREYWRTLIYCYKLKYFKKK